MSTSPHNLAVTWGRLFGQGEWGAARHVYRWKTGAAFWNANKILGIFGAGADSATP